MAEARTQTDIRIDDLRSDTRAGFARADKQVDDLRTDTRAGFARVEADLRELRIAIGSFQRLMIGFFATTIGSIVAGVIVLVLSHP